MLLLLATSCSGGSAGPGDGADGPDGGGDGGVPCPRPPADSDGDGIADVDESAAIKLDSDGDGKPDYQDDDADGDGISDRSESGDDNLCTPPRDADKDGVPDFRDLDADGNGIPDKTEGGGDNDRDGIVDADDVDDDNDSILDVDELGTGDKAGQDLDGDKDGIPDRFDADSDGDTVPDLVELNTDRDGDGNPNQRDLDSDGDCIPDTVEAGPDPAHPLNADNDAYPDFLDFDSDNDGLPDGKEDLDCNGRVDAGESDPRRADTDGDGFPDVVERAAGTDPADPKSKLAPGDFYFVLPYMDPPGEAPLDFQTDIVKADMLIEVDTTGSMRGVVQKLQETLINKLVPGAAKVIPNLAECVASFQDFPLDGQSWGGCGGGGAREDAPFRLMQRCSTSLLLAAGAVDKLDKPMGCGGDEPEAGYEALYQAATGEGIAWPGGEVAKFDPKLDYDAKLDMGPLGGAGFRVGALPIIVHVTDTISHQQTDYVSQIPGAHSRDDAIAALEAAGAKVVGIATSPKAIVQLEDVARDTGSVVEASEAFPTGAGKCLTGISGGARDAVGGLCPLVFQIKGDGTGLADAIIDAIAALAFHSTIDVTGLALGDPARLPGLDTSQFVKAITPVPPAPPGASISGPAFTRVRPSSPVRFTVRAQNDFVVPTGDVQLFQLTIEVLGDLVTVLDQRRVFVIVPPVIGPR